MKRAAVLIAALMLALGQVIVPAASAPPAQVPDPVIDMKGVDAEKYAKDLTECKALAEATVSPPAAAPAPATAAEKAKASVTGVAKAGAKAVAKNGLNVLQGAGTFVKEISGENAAARKHTIIVNCVKGRGYAVLE